MYHHFMVGYIVYFLEIILKKKYSEFRMDMDP